MDAVETEVSELILLREFYARWKRVHKAMLEMRGRELTAIDKMKVGAMGQQLVDQSHLVDDHARERMNG